MENERIDWDQKKHAMYITDGTHIRIRPDQNNGSQNIKSRLIERVHIRTQLMNKNSEPKQIGLLQVCTFQDTPVQEINSKALFLRYWLTIYNWCQVKLNLIRFSVSDWNHRRYIGWVLARKTEHTQWWKSMQPYIWAIVYQKTYLYHLNI